MRPRLLMVARGNNRNNGSNLGIAYLNANNALSNSNGNNWRSRPTFTPCAATRTGEVLDSKPETPHKAARPREMRGAVKNVHERPVSRTRLASRRAAAPKGWRCAA